VLIQNKNNFYNNNSIYYKRPIKLTSNFIAVVYLQKLVLEPILEAYKARFSKTKKAFNFLKAFLKI
jgi:hypothetical protein